MDLPSVTAPNVDPILAGALVASVTAVAALLHRAEPKNRRAASRLALIAGSALLTLAWLSPLATVAQHYLVAAHLLQVTLVMGAAPPLLLLALPRASKVQLPRAVAAPLRIAVHPAFAIVLVNAAFFGWHMSAPFNAAIARWWLYDLEQISLLVASIAFWWPIVTPFSPPIRAMSPAGKMGYILLATIPQTFGGLAVALAHHVLYAGYSSAPRVLGIDVMTDQQIAGASIALVSKIALLTAFVIVFMRLLQSSSPESEDDSGGGGGGSPRIDAPRPVPSGSPRWLEDLEADRTVPEPSLPVPVRVRELAASGSGRG